VLKLSVTNKPGIPDLIAIPKGSDVKFIEVKRPGQKPRPLQVYRMKEITAHGVSATWFNGEYYDIE
jgi:hypothetical protein